MEMLYFFFFLTFTTSILSALQKRMSLTKPSWPLISVLPFLAPSRQLARTKKYDTHLENSLSLAGIRWGFWLKMNTVEWLVRMWYGWLVWKNTASGHIFLDPFSSVLPEIRNLISAKNNSDVKHGHRKLDLKDEWGDWFQKFERSKLWVECIPNQFEVNQWL